MSRTSNFLTDVIVDYLKRSVDEFLRWILGRALRYTISAALFVMAAAFLLLGGSEGLILSGVPRYLAHLAIGSASLLAGFVVLKSCAPPSERK